MRLSIRKLKQIIASSIKIKTQKPMTRILRKNIRNLTVVGLLTILTFLFLHSELGLASEQESNHSNHDFCDLVSNSTTQGVSVVQFLKIINVNINSFIVGLRFFSQENSSLLTLIIPVEHFLTNSSRLSFLSTFLI